MTASGQTLWREHYDPYGQKLNGVNDKIGYTGHAFDAESGLTYAQARFYDAAVGRFLSVDPFGFTGDPFSFNRYAYVNNNPYGGTDPTGMVALTESDYKKLSTDQVSFSGSGEFKVEGRQQAGDSAASSTAGGTSAGNTGGSGGIVASSTAAGIGGASESGGLAGLIRMLAINPAAALAIIGSAILSGDTIQTPDVYVVRAGVPSPENLQNSVSDHNRVPDLSGFSVQSAPGVSVQDLAAQLPSTGDRKTIGVSTVSRLNAIGSSVLSSPGFGAFHATVVTPNPLSGAQATAISGAFAVIPNPSYGR